jgi:peptidyl-prolyl cis-trans isomerase C
LQAGADFAALAQANSLDGGGAPQGGDLGCFPRGAMVAPFEKVAFTAPLDIVSAPVKSQFGYHLILPYNRIPASVPPLSEVEARVRASVEREVLAALIRAYREGPGIELFAEHITAEEAE